MRILFALAIVLLTTAFACEKGARNYTEPMVSVRGRITDDSGECPTLRDTYGQIYSLVGDLGGFRRGDRVCVKGRRIEFEGCDRGITLKVEWIGSARACS